LRYNVGANAYAIIGDTYISIGATAADFSINSIDYAYSTATASFNSAFVLGSTGEISIVNSYVAGIMPSVLTSDVGFVKFNVASQSFVGTPSFTDISVNAAGYKDYTLGALSTNDFYVSATGSNGLKLNSWY
jgi:hypothetical protein